MDSPAAVRRRRRRRVPDEIRKRAPRACIRCKARKSKCIETSRGVCQRCAESSVNCEFERELSHEPAGPSLPRENQISPSATFASDSPAERFMWPRFLSRLRETFSLDTETTPELPSSILTQVQVPRHSPDSISRVREAARGFPPRAVARFLVSVCNEHGTDSFHYFNTAQFSAELDEFYDNVRSPLRIDSAFICLAHATFALGSQWATLVRPEGTRTTLAAQDGDPGRLFYRQARLLVPDIIELNSVRTVQAAFVIGVYLLPASAISSSYVYLGLALRKALALDLHQETEETQISDTEKELRRRLWWAVYSLERCTTVKLNRPRSIESAIITVNLPSQLPALDTQQAFNNVDHQAANARLMLILDRVEEPM
ncbi:fungal-specific transcription factor domain-containing protein [Boeremia exigua]|uniref:fungal-specific transcription factor domain-containing protein n=1 Tax=Boeremia exigua TaxID=749465 RepID=UPI001E8D7C51|nr:fungal-specific transcription factor domain-containing protein [Boeremia exigua]KAH6625156.1 fungal-specific transcription factor domain-containing protein [Boeremia exigua]